MSPIDASMIPMLEMFVFETTTLLEQLDEILLESEKSKSLGEENINEIFRIMHTIKGSSAMMGIENMSTLAHRVEDMFFLIREDPSRLNANSGTIFDLVFQASDYFKAEIEVVQDPDYTPSNADSLIEAFSREVAVMKGELAPAPAAPTVQTTQTAPVQQQTQAQAVVTEMVSTPVSDNNAMHAIKIFFEDDCQMENIRAFMLLTQLKDCCDYIESIPSHPEADSSLSNEIIKNGFLINFRTSGSMDEVLRIIENSINIKSYEILNSAEKAEVKTDSSASSAVASTESQTAEVSVQDTAAVNNQNKIGKQSLISVNQVKLDQLMDIVGEIVTAESMVASNPELKGLMLDNFHKSTRQLRKLTDELQDIVMSIRMVPLSGVFQKMNRIVRDMSKKLNKSVELETIGGDTEVDKSINDIIADPFMHMIRNAMDHAIESPEERIAAGKPETGTITISAQNIGGEIVINIADDGKGLDASKILKKAKDKGLLVKPETDYTTKEIYSLIMLPGFSTNEQVTEYSGRGVGMDVVRKNIEKVGGMVTVESVPGEGTTFTIKIPLTLAIVDGMEVAIGDTMFTIPITSIKESFKISSDTQILHDTNDNELIMIRGECYPIIRLHEIYNIPNSKTDLSDGIIILVENGKKVSCLFADELIGEQQVVVKPFPVFLNQYDVKGNGLSGCTILGDGSISLILDANNLLNKY